jgi:hypothetical protein
MPSRAIGRAKWDSAPGVRQPLEIIHVGDLVLAGQQDDQGALERSGDRAVHDDIEDPVDASSSTATPVSGVGDAGKSR